MSSVWATIPALVPPHLYQLAMVNLFNFSHSNKYVVILIIITWISLITNNVECIFMCLFAVCYLFWCSACLVVINSFAFFLLLFLFYWVFVLFCLETSSCPFLLSFPHRDRVFSIIKDLPSYLCKGEQGLRIPCKFYWEYISRIS